MRRAAFSGSAEGAGSAGRFPKRSSGSGEVEPLGVGPVHRVQGMEHEGQGEGKGEGVRDGLGGHEALEAEEVVSDEDGGQEEDALPRRGDDAGGRPDR